MVNIPQGVEEGSRVRLRGQGQHGADGGPLGDLIVTVRVGRHRFFERKGANIYCEVPINFPQAALGSKIRVRTAHGKKTILTIPPGTQTGTVFRLAGMGLRRGDAQGDQFVKVKVTTPEDLSSRGRELLEAFAEETGLKH